MNAILFVLATGIVASTVVELLEYRRRYLMRKKQRIPASWWPFDPSPRS